MAQLVEMRLQVALDGGEIWHSRKVRKRIISHRILGSLEGCEKERGQSPRLSIDPEMNEIN